MSEVILHSLKAAASLSSWRLRFIPTLKCGVSDANDKQKNAGVPASKREPPALHGSLAIYCAANTFVLACLRETRQGRIPDQEGPLCKLLGVEADLL